MLTVNLYLLVIHAEKQTSCRSNYACQYHICSNMHIIELIPALLQPADRHAPRHFSLFQSPLLCVQNSNSNRLRPWIPASKILNKNYTQTEIHPHLPVLIHPTVMLVKSDKDSTPNSAKSRQPLLTSLGKGTTKTQIFNANKTRKYRLKEKDIQRYSQG